MKQITALFCLLFSFTLVSGQKVNGKLLFTQGQALGITMNLKTNIAQQAMGQAIDFDLTGSANHQYKITNATDDNTTLRHTISQVGFTFDGMGQKRAFDSRNEKDMNGQFGKPMKELLSKSFDMIVDPGGKALMIMPEKLESVQVDERMAIITNMLRDVMDIMHPPQKGKASFFKVLPDAEVGKGDKWSDTLYSEAIKSITDYTLADINDSTIVIDLLANSVTTTKAEMMGNETVTTMNNKTSGKIILDRVTGIIREKSTSTESNGSTAVMGSSLPVTSKTTITILVKPLF